jgi:hypothetical protein
MKQAVVHVTFQGGWTLTAEYFSAKDSRIFSVLSSEDHTLPWRNAITGISSLRYLIVLDIIESGLLINRAVKKKFSLPSSSFFHSKTLADWINTHHRMVYHILFYHTLPLHLFYHTYFSRFTFLFSSPSSPLLYIGIGTNFSMQRVKFLQTVAKCKKNKASFPYSAPVWRFKCAFRTLSRTWMST